MKFFCTRQQQAYRCCIDRVANDVVHAACVLRRTYPYGHMKNLYSELNHSFQLGSTAREHYACWDELFKTGATNFALNQRE